MGSEFIRALRPAFVLAALLTLLLGVGYPFVILGIGQAIFPHQANGSLIEDGGKIVGSDLIGQGFATPRYFHGRPSAAGKGYDANASSGSNLGPASKALHDRIAGDIAALRKDGVASEIPADLVTAGGSGLDPDLSPAAVMIQVPRVAKARGTSEDAVRKLVDAHTDRPSLGLIGEPHVNVLALNRALDAAGEKR